MSELSRDEALVAAAVWMATSRTWDSCKEDARGAIHSNRPASAEIRTALAGGGGAEKVERPEIIDADRVGETRLYMLSLESRLAAAEKRAEEAERNQSTTTRCRDAERERDALKAELAEAKTALLRERERRESSRDERDAALARVKELEDAMGRIHDVWMATDVNALNLALANMDIPTRVTT